MNKEHFWPEWLILHTRTHQTGVKIGSDKKVNPRRVKVPLCVKCNSDFGVELETPMSGILRDLEGGRGISDREAEILVRWLWKLAGLAWCMKHPTVRYTEKYQLRDRVLRPIDEIRPALRLAVGIAEALDPKYGDAPMGLDSWNENSAVHVAGVFGRVAMMVFLASFEAGVPNNFSLYRFGPPNAPDRDSKLFFPKIGFRTCEEAVYETMIIAAHMSLAHEKVFVPAPAASG
jgi:hypothetical protein